MNNQPKNLQSQVVSDQEEYQIVKSDLIRVVIMDTIFLAAMLIVFFTNNKSHYLEAWFSKIFHF